MLACKSTIWCLSSVPWTHLRIWFILCLAEKEPGKTLSKATQQQCFLLPLNPSDHCLSISINPHSSNIQPTDDFLNKWKSHKTNAWSYQEWGTSLCSILNRRGGDVSRVYSSHPVTTHSRPPGLKLGWQEPNILATLKPLVVCRCLALIANRSTSHGTQHPFARIKTEQPTVVQ